VKIQNFLGLKKRRTQRNPHKAAPDVYFRSIWYSKTLYRGFQYISTLEGTSIRATANKLSMLTQRDYIIDVVQEAGKRYLAELNELYRRGFDEKSAHLWFILLHKVVADRAASST
jgi:hypothetical protein